MVAGLALAGGMVALKADRVMAQPPQQEPWVAPSRAAKKANPVKPDSASLDAGKRIYDRECLSCHGPKGAGDGAKAADLERKPGNLASPAMWEQSDGALFWKISEGKSPMPATKTLISDDERWHVINFLRTLAPQDSAPTPPQYAMPESYRKSVSAAIRAYEPLRAALAGSGDGAAAAKAVPALADALGALSKVNDPAADQAAASAWRDDAAACAAAGSGLRAAGTDVSQLRQAFGAASSSLVRAIERYGHAEAGPVLVFMGALVKGGPATPWIQSDPTPRDPYGVGVDKQTPSKRLAGQRKP
jgi:mono/diheme cytochrome c family protein